MEYLINLASTLVVAVSAYVAIRVQVAKLETRQTTLIEQIKELTEWKNALSTNGSSPYVRRTECFLMEGIVKDKLVDINKRLDVIDDRLRTLESHHRA